MKNDSRLKKEKKKGGGGGYYRSLSEALFALQEHKENPREASKGPLGLLVGIKAGTRTELSWKRKHKENFSDKNETIRSYKPVTEKSFFLLLWFDSSVISLQNLT